jgi:hypothetical protein
VHLVEEIQLPQPDWDYHNALNDMSIHSFPPAKLSNIPEMFWEVRPPVKFDQTEVL